MGAWALAWLLQPSACAATRPALPCLQLCSLPPGPLPQAGDRVLVAEACNHNRITDICNDIGMVQVGGGEGRCH